MPRMHHGVKCYVTAEELVAAAATGSLAPDFRISISERLGTVTASRPVTVNGKSDMILAFSDSLADFALAAAKALNIQAVRTTHLDNPANWESVQ